MYCVKCGKKIPDEYKFCAYCGAPVDTDGAENENQKTDYEKGQQFERQRNRQASPEPEFQVPPRPEFISAEEPEEQKPYIKKQTETVGGLTTRKKTLILILILEIVAAAALIIAVTKPFDLQELKRQSEAGTVENEKDIDYSVALKSYDVTVMDSDWDWDSSISSEGMYKVDGILLVKNDSDSPITRIDFNVDSRKGNQIENAENPGIPFSAAGYIGSGEQGIMVAEVWLDKKKVKPDNDTYDVVKTYTNKAITDYSVPTGYISENYGDKSDYYDVVISNPNDTDVSKTSTVVAVKYDEGYQVIEEADATGKISSRIKANTPEYLQKKAFVDPNLYGNAHVEDYDVYVLDTEFYKSYNGD